MPNSKLGEQAARPLQAFDSVRTRLSVVLALAMLPILAFSVASAVSELDSRTTAIEESLLYKARIVSKELDKTFASIRQVLYVARGQESVRNNSQPACNQALQSVLAGLPQFGNVATISSTGLVLCSAQPIEREIYVASDDWFQSIMDGENFVVGGVTESRINDEIILVAAEPIRLENTADSKAIALSIRTDFVGSALAIEAANEAVKDEVQLFLVDSSGTSLLPAQDSLSLPRADELAGFLTSENKFVPSAGLDGVDRLYAFVRIDQSDVYVVLSTPALAASLAVITELVGDVAATIILFAVTLLIVWLATERMSIRWVRHLRAVAIAHRRGMQGARARGLETAPIEYRELGESFNSMADAIERRQATLIQAIAERELLLKEIHHRVKNNLQIIISLFNLNARNAADDRERAHLRAMQMRVESLALVHHAAYQSEDMELIPVNEFLPTLLGHTERILEEDTALAVTSVNVDDLQLTMDQTVPLAQLILEVIAAIRLSGSNNGKLELALSFLRTGPARAALTISIKVDGPLDVTDKRLRLSRSLVGAFAKQLGGELTASEDLTHVTVDMPYTADDD